MSFTLAILGRPNVGKSTLFNRLTGKRHALVDDMPGVTRDWREGKGNLGPLEFTVIDTAGLEEARKDSLQARMMMQTEAALKKADVAMLVVDARAGLTPDDKHFAKLIRKSGKHMVLVVNKAEGNKAGAALHDAYSLGLGEPVAISAEHGEGMADLYDVLAKFEDAGLGSKDAEEEDESASLNSELQIAIVGRPNAGKSTLVNTIVGEERVLTGPEAGITRDAIAIDITHKGRKLRLIDTAGLRRKSNITGKIEKLAVADSLRAIQFAHVVVLVVDAEHPLEKQDNTIASLIEQEGRAMVVAVNKWDTVTDKQGLLDHIHHRLTDVMPQLKGVRVIPISALNGTHLDKLFNAAFDAYDTWNKRVTTTELNRWLEGAMEKHNPPMVNGRRIKLRYMTQTKARPPTFVLFASQTEKLPDSYQRYLVNDLRDTFDMQGVPIRMLLRKNKNPYV